MQPVSCNTDITRVFIYSHVRGVPAAAETESDDPQQVPGHDGAGVSVERGLSEAERQV